MTFPHSVLTKICHVCGAPRPLSAFLQLSETHGGLMYGNICVSCRSDIEEEKAAAASEATTNWDELKPKLELKIDAKSKAQAEVDQRTANKNLTEADQKLRSIKALLGKKRTQKTQQKASQERSHREKFLNKKSAAPTSKSGGPNKALAAAKQTAAKTFAAEHKRKTGDVNYGVEQLDMTRHGRLIKHHSPEFLRLQQWLGNSAFVRNVKSLKLTTVTATPTAPTLSPKKTTR